MKYHNRFATEKCKKSTNRSAAIGHGQFLYIFGICHPLLIVEKIKLMWGTPLTIPHSPPNTGRKNSRREIKP